MLTPRILFDERRGIAFRSGERQLEYFAWREAGSVEVLFLGHRADRLQLGTLRA